MGSKLSWNGIINPSPSSEHRRDPAGSSPNALPPQRPVVRRSLWMRVSPKTSKMESGNAASHGTRHPGISPRFQLHHRGGAQTSDEIEIAMSAVTVAELVHGIARAKKQEI